MSSLALCDKYKLTKYLVIVESPAKCKKIEQYLGASYKCMASYGHLCNITSLKNIDIDNNFAPTYTPLEDSIKIAQIKRIKEEIDKADEVIIASDDDREGEAIAYHICRIFGLPLTTTKRIIFHEITEEALLKAVAAPTVINMNMVYSQQARHVLDLLVGFTISPMLWKLVQSNKNNALSAGRCQTPALKLIYENYKEIKECKGRKVYNTTGYFTKLVLPFILNKEYEDDKDMEYFLESAANYEHIFTRTEPKQVTKKTPEPFTTSRLQQVASNELHYSPKETMKLCQTLYENGLITYMRTDSKKYSAEFVDTCKEYIIKNYENYEKDATESKYINQNVNNYVIGYTPALTVVLKETNIKLPIKTVKRKKPKDKDNDNQDKSTNTIASEKNEPIAKVKPQEAHEAIRPTNILCSPGKNIGIAKELSPREIKMYELIWTNSLESLMTDATFSSFNSKISAFEDNNFVYHSEQIVFPGWLIVENKYEKQSKDYTYLMALKQGSTIEYKKVESKQTIKSMKSHYTEAHLVNLLEDKGIGRPSTYAKLIDKIQERNYVKKEDIAGVEVICRDFVLEDEYLTESSTMRVIGNEKGKLVIQPLGIIVLEFLEKHYEKLFNYDYTKTMERGLDQIASGEKVWHELCRECYQELSISTSLLKNATKIEFLIDANNTYIIGKNGPVIKCIENGITTFKSVKKDIDMTLLEKGQYKLEDLVEIQTANGFNGHNLGKYKGDDLIVKKGKYGLYAIYGENRLSLSSFGNRPPENISFKEVFDILEEDGILKPSYCKDQKKLGVLREISASASVRDGKWGAYVYYKTTQMKTPKFFELKLFEKETGEKIKTCELNILKEWIKGKYNV